MSLNEEITNTFQIFITTQRFQKKITRLTSNLEPLR